MEVFGSMATAAFGSLHQDPISSGGLLGHLLRNNITQMDQTNFWSDYLISTIRKYYLAGCVVLLVWFILQCLLLVALYLGLHYRHARQRRRLKNTRSPPQKPQDDFTTLNGTVEHPYSNVPSPRVSSALPAPRRHVRMFSYQFYGMGLGLLIICILLFCCLLMQHFLLKHAASKDPYSVKGILANAVDNVGEFLKETSETGFTVLLDTFNTLLGEILGLLKLTINKLADRLFQHQGVTRLFETADQLIRKLGTVTETMKEIDKIQAPFQKTVTQYETNLANMQKQFQDLLPKLCAELLSRQFSTDLPQRCQIIQRIMPNLKIQMDPNKMNFKSVSLVMFALEQYQLNVTLLSGELKKGKAAITKILDDAYEGLLAGVNVSTLQATVAGKMKEVRGQVQSFQNTTLLSVKENESVALVSTYLTLLVVFCILIPLTLLFLYTLFCAAFVMSESALYVWKGQWIRKHVNKANYVAMQQLTASGREKRATPTPTLSKPDVRSTARRDFSYRWYFRLSLVSVGLSSLPIFGMVVFYGAGGFLHNEVCVQTTTPAGVQQLDQELNLYLNRTWDNLLKSLLPKDPTLDSLAPYLHLYPPRDIFVSLFEDCKKSNGSLIPAVGYFLEHLIDISGLLNSNLTQDFVVKGRGFVEVEVAKINVASLIPGSVKSLLGSSKDLVNTFIDAINHNETMDELQKPFLTLGTASNLAASPKEFITSANTFIHDVLTMEPANILATKLSVYTEQMAAENNGSLSSIEQYQVSLLLGFTFLQNNRDLSVAVMALMDSLMTVQNSFANMSAVLQLVGGIYDQVILEFKAEVQQPLRKALQSVEQGLIRCRYMHKAFATSTANACHGVVYEMGAVAMALVFVLIFLHLLLALLAFHLSLRRNLKHLTESV